MIPSLDDPKHSSTTNCKMEEADGGRAHKEEVDGIICERRDVLYNDIPASHFDLGLCVMSNEALLARRHHQYGFDDGVLAEVKASDSDCSFGADSGNFKKWKGSIPKSDKKKHTKRILDQRNVSFQHQTSSVPSVVATQHHDAGAATTCSTRSGDDAPRIEFSSGAKVVNVDPKTAHTVRISSSMQYTRPIMPEDTLSNSFSKLEGTIPISAPRIEGESSSKKKTKKRRSKSIIEHPERGSDDTSDGPVNTDDNISNSEDKKISQKRSSKSIEQPTKCSDHNTDDGHCEPVICKSTSILPNIITKTKMSATTLNKHDQSKSKKGRSRRRSLETGEGSKSKKSDGPRRRSSVGGVDEVINVDRTFSSKASNTRKNRKQSKPSTSKRDSKEHHRSRSTSPPRTQVDATVSVTTIPGETPPQEHSRSKSIEMVDQCEKRGNRWESNNKGISPSAASSSAAASIRTAPLRRRTKSVELRASDRSIFEIRRQCSDAKDDEHLLVSSSTILNQPGPLRYKSGSLAMSARSETRNGRSRNHSNSPIRRRSKSIDMVVNKSSTISSKKLLLAEGGDASMPLRPTGNEHGASGTGFLVNHKSPRRRGSIVKAFSFRRSKKNQQFQTLLDNGSISHNGSDSRHGDISGSNSQSISKQLSLRNLVDWRHNSNSTERNATSSPVVTGDARPLVAEVNNMTFSQTFGDGSYHETATIATIASQMRTPPSISCLQLTFDGEAVMTQLSQPDFSY